MRIVEADFEPTVRMRGEALRCEWTVPRRARGGYDTRDGTMVEPLKYLAESSAVLYYPSRRAFVKLFPCGSRASVLHADLPCAGRADTFDTLRIWFDRNSTARGFFLTDRVSGNHVRGSCRLGLVTELSFYDDARPFASPYVQLHGLAYAPTLLGVFEKLPCDHALTAEFDVFSIATDDGGFSFC